MFFALAFKKCIPCFCIFTTYHLEKCEKSICQPRENKYVMIRPQRYVAKCTVCDNFIYKRQKQEIFDIILFYLFNMYFEQEIK